VTASGGERARVRVRLPAQLRELAKLPPELVVEVEATPTQRSVLDALELAHPALTGTVRDRATAARRPFVRFFAGELDCSNAAPDEPLPEPVASGQEPFVVVGAIAGG
jgi:molybdopterin synthase sulfur carrier subunit